ncbi:early nodulin-like protein 9 [Vicia villosa]|uniref:early nodulin-like protein 9 n=1 Tax=Vicia villosa TaxID=3911 RepID=UPI00273B52CB|nr:early nodulin-like protein 9 [Vicia villosa]
MATFIFRSNKMVHALTWFCLMLMSHNCASYEFIVGGQKGWSVQGDSNYNPFNQWAEKSRFQVGDSLVFNYQTGKDSVFYVKSEDYASCNTASPYAEFSDGHTVFKFNQSGPHFFISGNKDNCVKNEKVKIIVLSDRSKSNSGSSSNTNQTSNASPPSPQSSSPPSPAPSKPDGQSPSPDTNQTPSSDHCHPLRNAASSVFFSFAGSVGTFMASVLILSKYI